MSRHLPVLRVHVRGCLENDGEPWRHFCRRSPGNGFRRTQDVSCIVLLTSRVEHGFFLFKKTKIHDRNNENVESLISDIHSHALGIWGANASSHTNCSISSSLLCGEGRIHFCRFFEKSGVTTGVNGWGCRAAVAKAGGDVKLAVLSAALPSKELLIRHRAGRMNQRQGQEKP